MNKLISCFSIIVAMFASGCASVTGNKNQPISIAAVCEASQVQGATCTLTNDKGVYYITTPGTAMIQKSTSDLSINCIKDKQSSNPYIVKSASNVNIWGNILLGGPIGAAIDAGTGAGFDYPSSLNVIFNSPCFQNEYLKSGGAGPQFGSMSNMAKEEKLKKLKDLYSSQLITEQQYNDQVRLILKN